MARSVQNASLSLSCLLLSQMCVPLSSPSSSLSRLSCMWIRQGQGTCPGCCSCLVGFVVVVIGHCLVFIAITVCCLTPYLPVINRY